YAQWKDSIAEKTYTINIAYMEGGQISRHTATAEATVTPGSEYTVDSDMTWVATYTNAYTSATQYKYVIDDSTSKTVTLDAETTVNVTFNIKTGLYASGLGTAESPYIMNNRIHFDNARYSVNCYLTLTADLDLGGTSYPFSTIGLGTETDTPFTGVLDGGGHKLSNVYISYSDSISCVGIIAINQGTVKDFTISVGSKWIEGGETVGSIVGQNEGLIEKIHVTGTGSKNTMNGTITGASVVGGIAGKNLTTGTIRYCSVDLNSVEGEYIVGGIVGANSGTVDQCYYKSISSNGNICAFYNSYQYEPSQVGGIVGDNYSGGVVSNCFVNSGGYLYTNYAGGGVVGYNRSGAQVKNCWVNWNVQPVQYNYYAGNNGRGIGLNEGSTSQNYAVVTSSAGTTENGFIRALASTVTGWTPTNHPSNWSTDIWLFKSGSAPSLKKWNKG
ncbi:MAG: hypothetical protein IJO93_06985, partial [Clostridia bacterium]|nr:hypothetical protein [Clostridia bacterium]